MSDPGRFVGCVGGIAGMAAMMVLWMRLNDAGIVGSVGITAAPIGSEVVMSLLTVLERLPPDRLVVGHAGLRITVWAPTVGIAVGDELTIGGVVRADGVAAQFIAPAPGRASKKRLSLLGLGAAALIGAGSVRLRRNGLERRG